MWPGRSGREGFAGRGWECRSGSGLGVQEREWPGSAGGLEVQSLLYIYLHQHLFLK